MSKTKGLRNAKTKDSSSKLIFADSLLCAQFLRGYVDIPLLKDVQPEDIEDVSNRYVHMFTEERNSDVVKKVRMKTGDTPFYLISLIEHKSDVDYNVIMQIFRYMVFIWEDYEKQMEKKQKGISRTKEFKYPPILPIVFYDGTDNWTAATRLRDKVLLSDILGEYIPDYKCMLVQLKDYSNARLMEKKDELSIIMMINKLQKAADFVNIGKEGGSEYVKEITAKSPEYLLDIMAQIIEVLLAKLNVPQEEAESFTEQIKERKMGELFAHFQGYDVQAVRKEEREKTEKEVTKKILEEDIEKLIKVVKKLTSSKDTAKQELIEQYALSDEKAAQKVELYW